MALFQATIQCPEFVDINLCVFFKRQVGDRLTQITVIMHNLLDAEPFAQQLAPVERGAFTDLGQNRRASPGRSGNLAALQGVRGLFDPQGSGDLVKKVWDPVGTRCVAGPLR